LFRQVFFVPHGGLQAPRSGHDIAFRAQDELNQQTSPPDSTVALNMLSTTLKSILPGLV
jgi:hypothetical protein